MLINIISTFKGQQQAKEALEEIRISSLANSKISVLTRTASMDQTFSEEFASELTYVLSEPSLENFNGWLVFTEPFNLVNIGEVVAAGPLANELIHGAENKSLSDHLLHHGLSDQRASYYEEKVRDGHYLILVETDSDKDSATANTLTRYGGRDIEKWHKELDHPIYPAH